MGFLVSQRFASIIFLVLPAEAVLGVVDISPEEIVISKKEAAVMMITTVSQTVEPVGWPPTQRTGYQEEKQTGTRAHRNTNNNWHQTGIGVIFISLCSSAREGREDNILFFNIFRVSRTYMASKYSIYYLYGKGMDKEEYTLFIIFQTSIQQYTALQWVVLYSKFPTIHDV